MTPDRDGAPTELIEPDELVIWQACMSDAEMDFEES